jgi:hypothetical protein
VAALCLAGPLAAAVPGDVDPPLSHARKIANAITELDVRGARQLLEQAEADSATLTFERARLAIYTGDCDGAQAILSAPAFASTPEVMGLAELSKSCARATAGAVIVEDAQHGVWLRLQDEADRALAPFIIDVAVRARQGIGQDLGVTLPRPLRIDLVRDLFSLSAVSGLPLNAAETTGTVAVARWGRVTMLSPRATPLGYHWEDTLAHEITHLALSRATRDRAPLWLQEGIAKREETRWREPRPFDNSPAADAVARSALVSGQSVGVDKLGASIALLPTPEAASIAFAEVTSFMGYFIQRSGEAALKLLLVDLKGTGSDDPSAALRSVTGYDLPAWIALWGQHLLEQRDPVAPKPDGKLAHGQIGKDPAPGADLSRRVRLGDLLMARGHAAAAAMQLEPAVSLAPNEPAVRWRAARALLMAGEAERAERALGQEAEVSSLHGAWFALHGRFLRAAGEAALADRAFQLGIAADPVFEDVACEGHWTGIQTGAAVSTSAPPAPRDPKRRALCASSRGIPRD